MQRSNGCRSQNPHPINTFRELACILLKMTSGRTGFVERGILVLREECSNHLPSNNVRFEREKRPSRPLFFGSDRPTGAGLPTRVHLNNGLSGDPSTRHLPLLLKRSYLAATADLYNSGNCLFFRHICPFFHHLPRIFSNPGEGLRNSSQNCCLIQMRLLEFVHKLSITTTYSSFFYIVVALDRGRAGRPSPLG